MNYLERSKKIFVKKLKKQNLKKNEWDIYAHENYLYSALTLEIHYLSDEEWVANTDYAISVGGKVLGFPVCIEARGVMYNATAIKEVVLI